CRAATLGARRNVFSGQQAAAAVAHATFTAHGFALFAAFDGLPSGAAADEAGLARGTPEFESTTRRSAGQWGRTVGPNERAGKAVWVCVNQGKERAREIPGLL